MTRLLRSLCQADYEQVQNDLEPVQFPYRDILYRPNKPIEFAYFLEAGVASLVHTMRNGDASEVGTIGNEGLVGLSIVFGDKQAPNSVCIQVPGCGYRLKAEALWRAMLR